MDKSLSKRAEHIYVYYLNRVFYYSTFTGKNIENVGVVIFIVLLRDCGGVLIRCIVAYFISFYYIM